MSLWPDTVFECQGCGATIAGPGDVVFGPADVTDERAMWRLIRFIDGPNACCPNCAATFDEVLKPVLVQDGWQNANLAPPGEFP